MTTNLRRKQLDKYSVAALGVDPFSWYAQMLRTDPVHLDEEMGCWLLFRYRDVAETLANPAIFSSERGITSEQAPISLTMIDPPRHRKLRALVSQAFTPRAVEQLAGHIQHIVDSLLDRAMTDGRMDVITDLAYPLPVTVIAEMLGIPSQDRDHFKRWSDGVIGDSAQQTIASTMALRQYFRALLPERRRKPQDDLISRLLAAQIDGEPLREDEIVDSCVFFLVAGNETTTNLIGNAVLCLDDYPEARAQLWADPALVPGTIEEVLRFLPPIQVINRVAKQEIEIAGKQITAGQSVFCWLAAANRDEAQFPQAETFDLARSPNRHLTFGHNIHFCLGAPLARLEAKIALTTLIERFSDIQRIRETPLQPIRSFLGYGFEHLPVRLLARKA